MDVVSDLEEGGDGGDEDGVGEEVDQGLGWIGGDDGVGEDVGQVLELEEAHVDGDLQIAIVELFQRLLGVMVLILKLMLLQGVVDGGGCVVDAVIRVVQ